ncbi:mechanosensitive ion channel family protein [Sulfitobacter sp. KE34]|uniref:Mechanosensitive ion channel family protein n=2 Tax=Sulfitobacter TaxID=60136 RepID=A0AAX3LSK1_9RHOB|nr:MULTISPECIES: mechanosensitive ion channel family protein [Sulfitobacter]MDF3350905.1 mechanosensitive ion channel family protein [Sulfitobacter sp. KE12]MDF3354577.1 mechanosensitive ion channel family protein [Sulfitobacter sp. KE27]MDF3358225.1 mechanosensitive ion channel family protein [Sulfitobacter sp. KE33]MDF3361229.1 mechanosensitive ion channel family protein [Sulfitobacter sp. Ks41]MDF3365649.1 mechanosensitive ion channel family protein [Sulfitobacter sp. Ks34]
METLDRIATGVATQLEAAPDFVSPLLAVLLACAAGLAAHWIGSSILDRVISEKNITGRSLLRRARRPLRLAAVVAALAWVLPNVRLYGWQDGAAHLFLVLLIILVGWTLILLTNHFAERAVRRHRLDVEDNLSARKFVTQARVLRRTVTIILGIFTAAGVLLTFESVQKYGAGLFASAGAAGLVVGLAARPVLTNLIAGLQIAITQPIRLEDVVIVEDEWGWVEEIFATYVVVRLWDWRRMVVPLSYFIEKPFQNWTRESASIIGTVFWYLDYTVPIGEMRAKLEELAKASPLWDGQVVNLQVSETEKDSIAVRGLVSARTSPQAWDLRCEIREKMIDWLQKEHPQALPRLRGNMEIRSRDEPDMSSKGEAPVMP